MLQIFAASALFVLTMAAAGFSGVSLYISLRALKVSPTQLSAQVHTLQSDLNELYDRVDHWQRRDRVRNLRASQGSVVAPPAPGTPEYKQYLRSRVAAGGLLKGAHEPTG